MRRSAKLLAALGVACLAAAGGSAFTNQNTLDPNATGIKVGYITTGTAGVVIKDIHYTMAADGTTVVSVQVRVNGDTHDSNMAIGFNLQNTSACNTGVYDGVNLVTNYSCTTTGTNATILTTAITSIEIVVS